MTEEKTAWDIAPESRRIAHPQKVYLKLPASDEFIEEYLVDLSMTGMFIRCRHPPIPGSIFFFKMKLSSGVSTVQGQAEVVWVREIQEVLADPRGMGVRFLHLDGESQRQIAETVERYAQAPGDPQEMTHLRSVVEETLGEVLAPRQESTPTPALEAPAPEAEPETEAVAVEESEGPSAFYADAGYGVARRSAPSPSRSRWVVAAFLAILLLLAGGWFWFQARNKPEKEPLSSSPAEAGSVPESPAESSP